MLVAAPPPRLVIAITMQLHRNRYDQFFYVHWWGGCSQWCHVASGWLVGFAGGSLSVGDVPKSGGLASLRSVTVGGEPVRDLLPTLSVH